MLASKRYTKVNPEIESLKLSSVIEISYVWKFQNSLSLKGKIFYDLQHSLTGILPFEPWELEN